MCQCHTMWQSEGAMQDQVAHSKKFPPGEKKFLHGVPDFFRGYPPRGGGYKKVRANFFHPPPPVSAMLAPQKRAPEEPRVEGGA